MVGAQLDGFECMVKLSKTSKIAVLEGDEYLSSPIDRRPKFHLYHPNIAVISGIAWDHINVFPTFENYVEQFKIFIEKVENSGVVVYYNGDKELTQLINKVDSPIAKIPYEAYPHYIKDGITYLKTNEGHKNVL